MFAVPSVRAWGRVLSRGRAVAAVAAAAAVTATTPLWAAVLLAPLAALAAGVLVPFASRWAEFEYEVGLEHWNAVYRGAFGTAGVAARDGPRGPTPPVYPNGWFKIAESAEVPAGAVKCVRLMGRELVLFRGAGGALGLLDAHCPHLGAHMGVGGAVTPDGCLQCPFHGWKFAPDGRCAEIPYSTGSVPPQAAARAHRVMETHRIVLAWYDAEGREVTDSPLSVLSSISLAAQYFFSFSSFLSPLLLSAAALHSGGRVARDSRRLQPGGPRDAPHSVPH